MERYKEYMDRIAIPDELHEKLVRPKPSASGHAFRNAVVSLACLCCVVGLMTMANGGAGAETTSGGALEMTHAAAQEVMDEEIMSEMSENVKTEQTPMDGARPESVVPESFIETGAGVPEAVIGAVGSSQNETIFPAWFAEYLPTVNADTYTETKTETAKGESLWMAKWWWDGRSVNLTLTERQVKDEAPITGEQTWEPGELWDEMKRQLDGQFRVLEQNKIDWTVSFRVEHHEVVYTLRGMQYEEVVECLRSIPFLTEVEEAEK